MRSCTEQKCHERDGRRWPNSTIGGNLIRGERKEGARKHIEESSPGACLRQQTGDTGRWEAYHRSGWHLRCLFHRRAQIGELRKNRCASLNFEDASPPLYNSGPGRDLEPGKPLGPWNAACTGAKIPITSASSSGEEGESLSCLLSKM